MYMIGLLPFGLNKLLILWLYAQQQQMKAAKIATLTLGTNIVFSLALITPLGGAGLALASTISGFIGFFATARTFSRAEFLAIISLKKTVLLLLSAAVFTLLLLLAKELIHVYL
jgi:putative peptidoglycan lipid II flippase